MGWIFEGLESSGDERRYGDLELIQRSIKRLMPYRRQIAISSATTMVLTIISLIIPIIFANLIEILDV
ncbi:hypothetical protein KA005_82400, partial [bacterium]|nr:hypothetical protein [bacterium]